MTISSLPREKINIPINKVDSSSSQKTWFIVFDKSSGIVKLFNVVSSIPLKAVLFSADQGFNDFAFFFLTQHLLRSLSISKLFNLWVLPFTNTKAWLKKNCLTKKSLGRGEASSNWAIEKTRWICQSDGMSNL